jgi:hypothetical protein
MSEHRNAVARVAGLSTARRRRWMIGAVAVLGASGLALGGLGVPVSANDLNTTGKVHASAEVQGDCMTAAAGTGEAEGSVHPQQDSELQATGQGTATVTVCQDGLGGTPPGDPGDPVPGDPDNVVPDDLDDVVPDDLAGELNDVVTGALEDGVPGDGDDFPPGDPGGEIPGGDGGDEDDVVPGDVGGLVPDGLGLVPNLLDRLAQIIPPAVGGGGPDGNDGGGPAINPSPSGTASGSVDVGGASADVIAEGGAATDSVLDAEVERGEPGVVGMVAAPGGSLPRTGGGLGSGLLRLIAFLGLGRALFALAKRWRPGAGLA